MTGEEKVKIVDEGIEMIHSLVCDSCNAPAPGGPNPGNPCESCEVGDVRRKLEELKKEIGR